MQGFNPAIGEMNPYIYFITNLIKKRTNFVLFKGFIKAFMNFVRNQIKMTEFKSFLKIDRAVRMLENKEVKSEKESQLVWVHK